ncbi:hypothetical protein ACWGLJ_22990 [Streptomyces sp. NPDC055898]|uniref:hypothetical protein n=1 Tax=unclassified Streptomyces TaxID=2593676 RepID=UPI0035DC962A
MTLLPEHRRGHGAMYGGLNHGRIDVDRLNGPCPWTPAAGPGHGDAVHHLGEQRGITRYDDLLLSIDQIATVTGAEPATVTAFLAAAHRGRLRGPGAAQTARPVPRNIRFSCRCSSSRAEPAQRPDPRANARRAPADRSAPQHLNQLTRDACGLAAFAQRGGQGVGELADGAVDGAGQHDGRHPVGRDGLA